MSYQAADKDMKTQTSSPQSGGWVPAEGAIPSVLLGTPVDSDCVGALDNVSQGISGSVVQPRIQPPKRRLAGLQALLIEQTDQAGKGGGRRRRCLSTLSISTSGEDDDFWC